MDKGTWKLIGQLLLVGTIIVVAFNLFKKDKTV